MSSAILYVAIVAIWACVLIPRWLRRDSARVAGGTADTPVPGEVPGGVVPSAVVPGDVVPAEDAADSDVYRTPEPASTVRARYPATFRTNVTVETDPEPVPDPVPDPVSEEAPASDTPPLAPEESRRRMLAARRRLLGMLTLLEGAAIALAMLGFAALWVLIPPSIMLLGYLLLLREAAHADAERAQREEEAARGEARAEARARERARERVVVAPAAPAAATRAAPAAPPAPPARYEDAGRDFAPGLAGKYTTSNEDYRDEYDESTVHRLRAVGD